MIQLYHGSTIDIERIDLQKSRPNSILAHQTMKIAQKVLDLATFNRFRHTEIQRMEFN